MSFSTVLETAEQVVASTQSVSTQFDELTAEPLLTGPWSQGPITFQEPREELIFSPAPPAVVTRLILPLVVGVASFSGTGHAEARSTHVYAPRPAALAVTQAPTVTPVQTTFIVRAASPPTRRRFSHIVAPRPAALTNHAILQAGSPQTVHVVTARTPGRQDRRWLVEAPRPAALTNHAQLAAGLPQTTHVVLAAQAPRQRHTSRITQARTIVVPAAPTTTPLRTTFLVGAASPQRQRHLGAVIAPRPSGLIFTPAAPAATPPRTVTVITARVVRQARRGDIVAPRPVFAPVAPPRPIVIIQAAAGRHKPRLGGIITRRVIVAPTPTVTPPRPLVIIQATPRRRTRLAAVIAPLRQRFASAGPPPTSVAITTPVTGYVDGTPDSGTVTL